MKTKTFIIAVSSAVTFAFNTVAQQPLSLETSFINPTCNGLANGEVTIDILGGTAPYRVNGSTISGSHFTVSSLAQGTYSYTIADANSVVALSMVTMVAPEALMVQAVIHDVTTLNGADGKIDVTVLNAQVNYQWSAASGSLSNPTREDQSDLRAGTYNLTMRQENGCETTRQYVVHEPTVHPHSLPGFIGNTQGLGGNLTSAITVYPNPSNGHVNLKNNKDTRETMIVNDLGTVLHTFRGANNGTIEGVSLLFFKFTCPLDGFGYTVIALVRFPPNPCVLPMKPGKECG